MMKKVNVLDFLNQKEFDVDLFSEGGEKICSADEKITPEILLKLYFQNICVEESSSQLLKNQIINEVVEFVPFDKKEAEKVTEYSLLIGKLLNFSPEKLKELEQAAYNHNIGVIKIKTEDQDKENYKTRRADLGYKYIYEELKLPDEIAEVARLYGKRYNCNEFELITQNKKNMPYYHIVSIANFYYNYSSNGSTLEETLKKMIRIGNKKFNTFILHKFINKMRTQDGQQI